MYKNFIEIGDKIPVRKGILVLLGLVLLIVVIVWFGSNYSFDFEVDLSRILKE